MATVSIAVEILDMDQWCALEVLAPTTELCKTQVLYTATLYLTTSLYLTRNDPILIFAIG